MNEFDKLVDTSGIITTKDILNNNQSKAEFYNYLKDNNFKQVSRGIYVSKDMWADPLQIAHMRCPNAVISHDSALYYYGLTDREPSSATLTVYSGYNATRLKAAGFKLFFIKKKYLELGKTEVTDLNGNLVPMYDLERTICDLVRNRNSFESQDFNSALKAYAGKKGKNLTQLFEYAKLLRIEKLIRSYMEILL